MKTIRSGKEIIQAEEKICKVCQRKFANRKRWASRDIWQEVQYCSQLCRKMRNNKEFLAKYQ